MTQWFLDHPWAGAAASGTLIAAWTLVVTHGVWILAAALGFVMFLLVGLLWREGGPGYRLRQWILRKFPKDPPSSA